MKTHILDIILACLLLYNVYNLGHVIFFDKRTSEQIEKQVQQYRFEYARSMILQTSKEQYDAEVQKCHTFANPFACVAAIDKYAIVKDVTRSYKKALKIHGAPGEENLHKNYLSPIAGIIFFGLLLYGALGPFSQKRKTSLAT